MKKLVSSIVVFCMFFSCTGFAYAESPNECPNAYWGYNGKTIEIDKFTTDTYAMASFYDGNLVYVITVWLNGDIEFSWAPVGGAVSSTKFSLNDINITDTSDSLDFISNETFINSAKEYGLKSSNESTVIYELSESSLVNTSGNITITGMEISDYNALIAQMEELHGEEYTMENWTSSNVVGGLSYDYKENLNYDMVYRDSVRYTRNMTLGSLITTLLATIPGISAPMSIIAAVLGVSAAENAYLVDDGQIASYYGAAVYTRFVLVDNSGPYYECYHTIDYDGWIKVGAPGSAELLETGDYYNPSQSMFDSAVLQRQRATENYGG